MSMPFVESRAKYYRTLGIWSGAFTTVLLAMGIYEAFGGTEIFSAKAPRVLVAQTMAPRSKPQEEKIKPDEVEARGLSSNEARAALVTCFGLGLFTFSMSRRSKELFQAARLIPLAYDSVVSKQEALELALARNEAHRTISGMRNRLKLEIVQLDRMERNLDLILKEKDPALDRIMQAITEIKGKNEDKEPDGDKTVTPKNATKPNDGVESVRN